MSQNIDSNRQFTIIARQKLLTLQRTKLTAMKSKLALVFSVSLLVTILWVIDITNPTRFKQRMEFSRNRIRYSWMKHAIEASRIDEHILRCKAQDLGCFTLVISNVGTAYVEKILDKNQHESSRHQCLNECFSGGFEFAGYQPTVGNCYCSESFIGFLATDHFAADLSADMAKNCTQFSSVHAYRKIRECERGVSENSLKQTQIGCMQVPKELTGSMTSLGMSDFTLQQCILNCEVRAFPIALLVQHSDICICSDLYSMFKTAELMRNVMLSCDKSETMKLAPVHRTSTNDAHCGSTQFLPPGITPGVLLVSPPGSGNTWLRHLIETSTGYYTGSRYNDKKLYRGGFFGEKLPVNATHSGRVIAIKDHLLNSDLLDVYKSAILLIRNPYDSSLAEFTRRRSKNHTGIINPEVYKSQDFRTYARQDPDKWYKMAKIVMQGIKSVLVIYYEDIVSNPVKQLRRVLEFLPRGLINTTTEHIEGRLMCMNLDLEGRYKRPSKNLEFNPFDAFVRNAIDKSIQSFEDMMAKYKQPPLPDSFFLM